MRRRPSPAAAFAWLIAAPWCAWAVVRALGLDVGHPLVALMAFTPWAAATSVVPVASALLLRARAPAIAAGAAGAVLVVAVAGRALPDDQPDAGGREVVVVSANLLGGRADAAAVVRLVRRERADVLSLQELTPSSVARLRAAGLEDVLPHGLDDSRPGADGTGLWTRAPLRRTARQRHPTRAQEPEGAIAALGLRVRAVHPRPPVSRSWERDWRDALHDLPGAGDRPLRILAGDFNATLDHRALRRLLDRGYRDAADATGAGLRWTWPVGRPRPPLVIDHVLVDRRIRVEAFTVHEVPRSDHGAVVARLRLP